MDETAHLHEVVNDFIAYISRLPADALKPDVWSPREVLVHLVFWHERYISIISAALDGREPDLLTGSGKALNAMPVRENAGAPIGLLIERFQAAQAELEELTASEAARSVTIRIRLNTKERTVNDLLHAVEGHIRNHLAKLRKVSRQSVR